MSRSLNGLRLFPLNAVLFPGAVLNLHVFEPRYEEMLSECIRSGEGFGIVLIREGCEAGDPHVDPFEVGCIAEIAEVTALPHGRFYVSTLGRERFVIRRILSREPFLRVDAQTLDEDADDSRETMLLRERVGELFLEYLRLLVAVRGEERTIDFPEEALAASYVIADALHVADRIKQRLLELQETKARLHVELRFLQRILPQLRALLERRERELQARRERGEDEVPRAEQKRYFGKYFSAN